MKTKYLKLEKLLKEARELIHQMTDDERCSLDHHGYCQTHDWFNEGECVDARAIEFLKKTNQ